VFFAVIITRVLRLDWSPQSHPPRQWENCRRRCDTRICCLFRDWLQPLSCSHQTHWSLCILRSPCPACLVCTGRRVSAAWSFSIQDSSGLECLLPGSSSGESSADRRLASPLARLTCSVTPRAAPSCPDGREQSQYCPPRFCVSNHFC